jgi:hypothetical protein
VALANRVTRRFTAVVRLGPVILFIKPVKSTCRGWKVGAAFGFILICFCAASEVLANQPPSKIPATVYWNRVARDLVRSDALSPPHAARVYGYLSVGQYRALLALRRESHWRGGAVDEEQLSRRVISAASEIILESFFPRYAIKLSETYGEFEAGWYVGGQRLDRASDRLADVLGHAAAISILRRAEHDGATYPRPITLPEGPNLWRNQPDRRPVEPTWGEVRPLGVASIEDIPLEEPPKVGSTRFREAIEVVRKMASGAGRVELDSVSEWADDAGTATPPGHWNAIAEEIANSYNLDEARTVQLFALLNVALFDASIVCWRTKYRYFYPRPSQMDPTIDTHLSVPNFPSFTSGHATFSGAAAAILAFLFPAESTKLAHLAESAAMSRVYAGIHYPFDSEVGLRQGRAVAQLVISQAIDLGERFYTDVRQNPQFNTEQ